MIRRVRGDLRAMELAMLRWVWMGVLAFGMWKSCILKAQSLVSEPILGAMDTHSAKVWFMVKDVENVALEAGGTVYKFLEKPHGSWKGNIPVTIEVTGLSAGQELDCQVLLDGKPFGSRFRMRAAAATPSKSWSFMMGSCAFYGVGATRIIRPGVYNDIFDAMRGVPTDFMLWLGDNVYLLNGEWNSLSRTYEKYTKVRLDPQINAFLRSRPQLAILDDHDFGPDNCEGSFENKGMTVGCFKDFWPNPPYANPDEGTYAKFDYQDASFFMLDDRSFRIVEGSKQILGFAQMEWLKTELAQSKSAFKFLVLGSQILSELNQHLTWSKFPERQQLLDFIKEKRIPGVIFLSGDRHFTELCKLEIPGCYPLYDFTSSPLTSILRKQVDNPKDVEYNNPLRVPGTKLVQHNFGVVTVEGELGDRTCRMQTYDAFGKLVWEQRVTQKELDWTN